MSTFRSKEDMLLAIQKNTETLDKQKNEIEVNLNRFTEQLKKQQKEAAVFERDAQPIPRKLLDELKLTETRIEQTQGTLRDHIEKQDEIKKYKAEIQQKVGLKREELYKPILDKVKAEIEKLGKEGGYTMIFDSSAGMILHAADSENLMTLLKSKLGVH